MLLVAACQSAEEKAQSAIERGRAFVEEGRDRDAVIEFRAAISEDPTSAEAHYELARAYLRTKNGPGAFWALQESVRLDPDNDDARRSLGGIAIAAKDFDEALIQADEAIRRDHTSADAYLIRGRALEGLKRPDEAESAYRAAFDVRPEDPGYVMVLSGFYERSGDKEKAEKYMRQVVEMDSGYEVQLGLAYFLRRLGERDDEVLEALKKALDLAKENQKQHVYSALGRFHASREENDKVVEVLKEGIEVVRKSEALIIQLTKFYRRQGENEKADELIQSVTQGKRTTNPEPHLTLASYRLERGDLEGALAAADAAIDADPTHVQSRLRKAEILLEVGYPNDPQKIAEARVLAEGVLAEEPANTDSMFVRAKVELAEGSLEASTATLREIAAARPDWPQAHLLLGSILYDLGDLKQARAELARTIELDAGSLDARYLMAKVHYALGEYEFAIEQGRVYLRVYRGHVPTRLMLSQSLFALGRRDDAARELEAIDEEARTIEVYFALGRLAQERGDLEKAKEFLMAANEAQPNEPVVLNAMLNAEAAQGDLEASLNRIASAVEADPESATLRTLLGRVQLLSGDQESAEKSFEQAIALESKDLSAYRMLAEIHHGRGDFKKAIDVFDRASKAQPDAGWVYERLGLLHEKNDDAKSAISSYELAVEKDASLGISKNNLSYLLAENDGDLDRALTLAMEAKKLRPKDPGAADTLGWVLFKKGRTAEAITYLREAESGWGDDSLSVGVVKHHLAVAYEADGAPEKAEQVLADALAGLDRQLEQAKIAGTEIKEPYWVSAVREMQTRLKN